MSFGTGKYGVWNNKQALTKNYVPIFCFDTKNEGGKVENNRVGLGTKFSSTNQKSFDRNTAWPAKRQRLGEDLNTADGGETSSDSDKEQRLTKYYSAAISLAHTPEDKKERENILSRTFEESGSKAVEDIDWDALTVKGTCQDTGKRYLRLTSAPDPAMVRPDEVLEKALEMVHNSQKNYLYKLDQLKSMRQDLTAQHIHNELIVKVYACSTGHRSWGLARVQSLSANHNCKLFMQKGFRDAIWNLQHTIYEYVLYLHSNITMVLVSAMSRVMSELPSAGVMPETTVVRPQEPRSFFTITQKPFHNSHIS